MEAARGATLAVHAACGLASPHSREAGRLLRAAEGLCRAGTALLVALHKAPPPAAAPEVEVAEEANELKKEAGRERPRTKRTRQRRRQSKRSGGIVVPTMEVDAGAGGPPAAVASGAAEGEVQQLELPGSVVVGDLSELYAQPPPAPGVPSSSSARTSPGRGGRRGSGGLGGGGVAADRAGLRAMVRRDLAAGEAAGLSERLLAAYRRELKELGG